jgi:hypothetical protein
MLWLEWHVIVAEFVSHFADRSEDESVNDQLTSSDCQSLLDAKSLRALQPVFSDVDASKSSDLIALLETKSSEILELDRIINEAEKAEREIREQLLRSREMLKGSLRKADRVRQHLGELKESLVAFKERPAGGGGLSLSAALEPELEHHTKVFSWLVSTLGEKFGAGIV